ncbi:MAG TPA: hypothetical protein VMV10_26310 [Pirellulales bacterium]|nr:hypothetical protein [Pirellulales bacterium]
MEGLEALILKLSAAEITGEVWVNGSFSTQKIDPEDADILVRVSSGIYDFDVAKRATVDWATHRDRWSDHTCDAYKWVEYQKGHPLFSLSEEDRRYWSDWFGKSRCGIPKGIFVIELPVAMP